MSKTLSIPGQSAGGWTVLKPWRRKLGGLFTRLAWKTSLKENRHDYFDVPDCNMQTISDHPLVSWTLDCHPTQKNSLTSVTMYWWSTLKLVSRSNEASRVSSGGGKQGVQGMPSLMHQFTNSTKGWYFVESCLAADLFEEKCLSRGVSF